MYARLPCVLKILESTVKNLEPLVLRLSPDHKFAISHIAIYKGTKNFLHVRVLLLFDRFVLQYGCRNDLDENLGVFLSTKLLMPQTNPSSLMTTPGSRFHRPTFP